MDGDAEGLINFSEFARWQQQRLAGKRPPARQLHLAGLIRDLARLRQSDRRFAAWCKLAEGAKAATELHGSGDVLGAVRCLGSAMRRAEGSLGPADEAIVELRRQSLEWQAACRERLAGNLEVAAAGPALEAALREAEEAGPDVALDAEVVQGYQQRLTAWRAPFTVHVSTLSGGEVTLEVQRSETVGALRERVARGLGKQAYRVALASVERRLEPDSATLEDCGVRSGAEAELAATFGPVDRWLEMSGPEFLELCVAWEVLSPATAAQVQAQVDSGDLSLQELRARHAPLVEEKEAAEAVRRRQREEAEARQRRLAGEAAEAAEALAVAARAERRAALAGTPVDGLLEQLEASADTSSSHWREGADREGLLELLAQRAAVECLEAEAVAARRELEALQAKREALREELERQISEVLPGIREADELVQGLRPQSVNEIRAYSRWPAGLLLTMEVLCVLFGVRPDRVRDPEDATRQLRDYHRPAMRHFLSNPSKFLQKMAEYDKESTSPEIAAQLERYMERQDFTPEHLRKVSLFCEAACAWVRSVVVQHGLALRTQPLKLMLLQYEEELERLALRQDALSARVFLESEVFAKRGGGREPAPTQSTSPMC